LTLDKNAGLHLAAKQLSLSYTPMALGKSASLMLLYLCLTRYEVHRLTNRDLWYMADSHSMDKPSLYMLILQKTLLYN